MKTSPDYWIKFGLAILIWFFVLLFVGGFLFMLFSIFFWH